MPKSDSSAKPPWPSTAVRHPRLKLPSSRHLESAPLLGVASSYRSGSAGAPSSPTRSVGEDGSVSADGLLAQVPAVCQVTVRADAGFFNRKVVEASKPARESRSSSPNSRAPSEGDRSVLPSPVSACNSMNWFKRLCLSEQYRLATLGTLRRRLPDDPWRVRPHAPGADTQTLFLSCEPEAIISMRLLLPAT